MRGVDKGSGMLYFNCFRSRPVDFGKSSLPFVIKLRGRGFGRSVRVNGEPGGEASEFGGDVEHARDLRQGGVFVLAIGDTAEERAGRGEQLL